MLLSALIVATSAAAAQTPRDDTLAAVEAALDAGQFWHATELLQPLLEGSSPEPAVIIAAARAADGWEGWHSVRRLLTDQAWLDDRFDRIGRRLLAEAALGLDQSREAERQAQLALEPTLLPRTRFEQARRWIALARAQERLHSWTDAARGYTEAAALLPDISDWLALRAAGVIDDSVARQRLYSTVTLPAARARIDWTEALALERFQHRNAAAAIYERLGDQARALRLRYEASPSGSPQRKRAASGLIRLASNRSDRGQARQAVATLLEYRIGDNAADSLTLAIAAAHNGFNSSARELLNALARSQGLDASQWLLLGDAESDLGKWAAAGRSYAMIPSGPLAGVAAYRSARAELRQGRFGAATRSLERVVSEHPEDDAAGTALYLLADLALDAGRPDSSRSLLLNLSARYPQNEFAARASLLAPLIAFANGRYPIARNELAAALEQGHLSGLDADAVRYWLARSLIASGDAAGGNALLQRLVTIGPENYYAILAASRLDTIPWRPFGPGSATSGELLVGARRARTLERLGLDVEAGFERQHLVADADSPAEIIATAQSLTMIGYPALSARMATKLARASGGPTVDSRRLEYLLPYQSSLIKSSAANGIDPWLVAAVIRQESGFNPRARSGAGALGLMQLMPGSGRDLARQVGLKHFDEAVLSQPAINLAMGTIHLARDLKRYPELQRSLAAYNGGPGRVDNWSGTLLDGSAAGDTLNDPELFVERIPYIETRNYIRRITVNREMYRLLYGTDSEVTE